MPRSITKKPWLPIDTAPTDGTAIIAKNPDDRGNHYPYRARFVDGQWMKLSWAGKVAPVTSQPTLWQPVPTMSDKPARAHSIGVRPSV
jgi:hypothetical protein